jgi:hypothetical protein
MTTVSIKSFSDVILFELQKRLVKQLTFSEMWRTCEDAAPDLEGHKSRSQFQNFFVRDIYDAVEDLEQKKLILVTRRKLGRYQLRMSSIRTSTYVVYRIASDAVRHYFSSSKNNRTCVPTILPRIGIAGAHLIGASASSGDSDRVVAPVGHWTRRRTFCFSALRGARQRIAPTPPFGSEGDD